MFTAGEIASHIGGKLEGNNNLEILGVCDLKDGRKKHISFLGNPVYKKYFRPTQASAVIIGDNLDVDRGEKTLIRVTNPGLGFARTLEMFKPEKSQNRGVHLNAVFGENVKLGKNIHIAPGVVIEENAVIGDNVTIHPGVVIGEQCEIGDNSTISPNVTIYNGMKVGKNVHIDAGAIIGADGFGWITDEGVHHKIPQIGSVIIENDVWIGANCTIDRGTFRSTIIGESSKLDNQVHVGHNVVIGKNCLIAGQTGIAGSSVIEDNVTIAGQCGVVDNIKISAGTVIGARTAVLQSIHEKSFVSGNPARDHKLRTRQEVVIQQLPEMLKRIRFLENFIKKFRKD